MSVAWIDNIYNNTKDVWQIQSIDQNHNGVLDCGDGKKLVLDDQKFHDIQPNTRYHAEWAGIPWYYRGRHYKALRVAGVSNSMGVNIFTSEIDGQNYIMYEDRKTGTVLAKQSIPKGFEEFHTTLRLEDGKSDQNPFGVYIDIVNHNEIIVFEVLDKTLGWVKSTLEEVARILGIAAGLGKII